MKTRKVCVSFSPMDAIVSENQVEKLCDALEKAVNKFTKDWSFEYEVEDVE